MPKIVARTPTAGEVEKAAEVASKAFPNLPLEHWQHEFQVRADEFGLESLLVAEMDGQIVSSLLMSPAPVYINEAPVPHAAVGGVGTLPDYRCNGCAGVMMTRCVKSLRDQGIYLSSLWPFSYEYYRKFGWEVGADIRAYTARGGVFADLWEPTGVREAVDDDFGDITEFYDEFAVSFNCLTDRSERWWREIPHFREPINQATDWARLIVCEEDDRIVGYAAYEVTQKEEKRVLAVQELAFLEPRYRRALLSFLGRLDPEREMVFNSPAEDSLLLEMPNPRLVECRVHPSFQFRVIDPERAMGALVVDEEIEGRLTLSIRDPVFEHGFEFGMEFDEGEVVLSKPEKRHVLEMDVQTLARLYSGYLGVMDAYVLGMVVCPGSMPETLAMAMAVFANYEPYRTRLEPG